jgi:hypothetical protein
MERAEPAIVFTAASMSAAVMSLTLVLAISSSWARVILPTLSRCARARALVELGGLLDQHGRCGRRLDDEGEALVGVSGDHHGQRQTWLDALGLGVERLAELHDIQATLAEGRADRGRRIGFACRNLQLDKTDDFFRHGFSLLAGTCAPTLWLGLPGVNDSRKIHPRRVEKRGLRDVRSFRSD